MNTVKSEVDLHLHTNASDGLLSPDALVRLTAERGLRYIAITDHDTTEGIPPALAAAAAYPQLTLIPGIELSTDEPGVEVHMLGYFVDHGDAHFQSTLLTLRASRHERARRMVDKLAALGRQVSFDRVRQLAAGGSVGRVHVAQTLLESGHVSTIQEAFDRFIARGRPVYVERYKITPEQAVQMVRTAGGLPVLAHPGDLANLGELLDRLIPAGLVGMEAYYANYSPVVIENLVSTAKRRDLVPTGDTDYHGLAAGLDAPGGIYVPAKSVERLMAARERLGC